MSRKDSKSKFSLKREHQQVSRELAVLNRELATKMILLASQTGDTGPLINAVDALKRADQLFSAESTPRETAEVRQALADTLYTLGKAKDDVAALEHSIEAYRGAITLASLLGDNDMRARLKKNYGLARNLLGNRSSTGKSRAA